MSGAADFTEATTGYWQDFVDAGGVVSAAPWRFSYPARLPDGRGLMLPIRALPPSPGAQGHGVASLLVNQASLEVQQALGRALAACLAPLAPEVIVGLPTLGLTLAPLVAQALGHPRFVPMGTSRKFWYDEALSAPVVSITSPGAGKRVYLDPHLLPQVRGRRVALVDDVVSTGSTALAPWRLLESLGADVVAFGVAMLQGRRWQHTLGPARAARVHGVFESPLLQLTPEGWVERPASNEGGCGPA